nr:hypothetical protein [Candidimonas humi]
MAQDKFVHLAQRQVGRGAIGGLDHFVGTFVVPVLATLAAGLRHADIAAIALDESGQQGRTGDVLRRATLLVWISGFTDTAGGVERGFVHDGGNRRANPLAFWTKLPGTGIPHVEAKLAPVSIVGQHGIQFLDLPGASTHEYSSLVQVFDDSFQAHRVALLPVKIQVIDFLDDQGFALVDFKAPTFAALMPHHLCFHSLIAERWARAIEEAPAGVLSHGAARVFTVLGGVLLVGKCQDIPYQLAFGVVPSRLGYRDDASARSFELEVVENVETSVAEEPGVRVHDDGFVGIWLCGCRVHHLLEYGAPVICA